MTANGPRFSRSSNIKVFNMHEHVTLIFLSMVFTLLLFAMVFFNFPAFRQLTGHFPGSLDILPYLAEISALCF